jgi:hypothetical protein
MPGLSRKKVYRIEPKKSLSEAEIPLQPEILPSRETKLTQTKAPRVWIKDFNPSFITEDNKNFYTIKLFPEGERIRVDLFPDNQVVKEMIETQLPHLQEAFRAQNLDLQKFAVLVGYGLDKGLTPKDDGEALLNNPVPLKESPESINHIPIPKEEVWEQIVKYARIEPKKGLSEAEIHLKPEILGSLKIKVSIDEAGVKASFFTDNHIVKEMIEAQLPHLREAFLAQNLDIQKFSVFVGYNPSKGTITANNSKDFSYEKEGRKNRRGKVALGLQKPKEPERYNPGLVDCFI